MAVRNRLHINHIPQLQDWLVKDGWKVEQPKGDWERIRARKGKRLMLFYDSANKVHLRYEDKWNGIVSQFLREVKGNVGDS